MQFRGYHFTPRLWPTLMTIPALVILCLLGNWQVARLEWKLDLIEKLETRYRLPAVSLPSKPTDPEDWEYRHVALTGQFLHMREMPLYGVGPDGKPGYDLFTPMLTTDGRYVIVNRGWVPEKMRAQPSRPDSVIAGEVALTGVLRKSSRRERFAPENDPARNQWFYGDVQEMARAQALRDVFPMFVYADKSSAGERYPVGGRTRLNIVNNHLDYAMTWYGLAAVLLVIYLLFHIRRDRAAA